MENKTAKNKKMESPKTPGGISKSLLTPCRRLGLSRNWRKSGPSPFVSPLSSTNVDKIEVEKETRKRKEPPKEEEIADVLVETTDGDDAKSIPSSVSASKNCDIYEHNTPSREIELPRKKKSKTLLSVKINKEIKKQDEFNALKDLSSNSAECEDISNDKNVATKVKKQDQVITTVAKVVHTPSVKKNLKVLKANLKNNKTSNSNIQDEIIDKRNEVKENSYDSTKPEQIIQLSSEHNVSKQKSPSDLTKECIVVIQKNILKTTCTKDHSIEEKNTKDVNSVSQEVFDSDCDDIPLSNLDKNIKHTGVKPVEIALDENFDTNTGRIKKMNDKNASSGDSKDKKKSKNSRSKASKIIPDVIKQLSQNSNSFDEDDDDFEFSKRTILIKKSYDKVARPLKAKSTGSITQRDVEELRARIEMKKKLLLAKAMTEDTEELRALIKKWQKGCQDALIELIELMKVKVPDKQNMDYSELLEMLRIPPALVGYDSENDIFNTPNDSSILLSTFD